MTRAEDTAQLHADQEDQSCFGQRSAVWRYPLPVFLRKTAEGTVEGTMVQPVGEWCAARRVKGVKMTTRSVFIQLTMATMVYYGLCLV